MNKGMPQLMKGNSAHYTFRANDGDFDRYNDCLSVQD